MKKLITTVAMTLCLMVIGATVYAACNSGSLKSGTPGTCTYEEPTTMPGAGSMYVWDQSANDGLGDWVDGIYVPGEAWCDLNTIGSSCWVTIYPE